MVTSRRSRRALTHARLPQVFDALLELTRLNVAPTAIHQARVAAAGERTGDDGEGGRSGS